ncbi:hypothetical protein H4R21_002944 [Coemansia helicoidea]|uniref:Uncharacterized protein n=1 Tax=Coemansia helicoidea TaxID=1286919 RepID=A0ACC1L5W2_9FUNG|nr:hypothetical protein H4R21_002944 [Coemansia helicoidea]
MKLAFAPVVLAAAAALAQQNPEAAMAAGETARAPVGALPVPAHTVSLLARLASYFDMSHVASSITTMPAAVAHVFDPASGKMTMLAASVMRAGDGYYMPVCPVSDIAQAGSMPAVATQAANCGYGIQLTPLPQNAARSLFAAFRTLSRAILSTVRVPTAGPASPAAAGMAAMMQPATPMVPQAPGMAPPSMEMAGMAPPSMEMSGMHRMPSMYQAPGMYQPQGMY